MRRIEASNLRLWAFVTINDRMSDKELREAWASNFTRRRTDPASQSICELIGQIISMRARTLSVEGSIDEKVRGICSAIGISFEEYQEVTIPKADH